MQYMSKSRISQQWRIVASLLCVFLHLPGIRLYPGMSRANSWNAFNNVSRLIPCYRYDAEADNLYGVTWYKDNEQFYKYEVKGPKKQRVFAVAGVRVNVSTEEQILVLRLSYCKPASLFSAVTSLTTFPSGTLQYSVFLFCFLFSLKKRLAFCKNRKTTWEGKGRKGLFRAQKRIRQTGKWQLRMGSKRVRQEMKNVCNPENAKYFNSDGLV